MDLSLARPDAALALFAGYLLGSIPFGLILTRHAGTQDIRSIGSGNIGATNVLRTGRKGLAAATLVGDALKGTIAVLIFKWLYGDAAALIAACGAFLGHLFPVWLGFKGGKGVATFIGILFGLAWPAGLFFCGVWLLAALLFRYSSLAALVASALTPTLLWYIAPPAVTAVIAALAVALWIKHRENIMRLVHGAEGKIGAKTEPEAAAGNN